MRLLITNTICLSVIGAMLLIGAGSAAARGGHHDDDDHRRGRHHHDGGDDHKKGHKNGKPFAELSEQIEANQAAIVDLAVQTTALEAELVVLKTDMVAMETRLFATESNVTAINGEIITLKSKIAATEAQLKSIILDIAALQGSDANNSQAIADLYNQVNALNIQLQADQRALANFQLEVRVQIDGLNTDIANLQLGLTETNLFVRAQVDALQAEIDRINAVNTRQDITLSELVANIATLSALQADVVKLQSDISFIVAQILQLRSDVDGLLAKNSSAVEGWQSVSAAVTVPAGKTITVTSFCPDGKFVFGGGVRRRSLAGTGSEGNWIVEGSAPATRHSWMSEITNNASFARTAWYIAICAFAQ